MKHSIRICAGLIVVLVLVPPALCAGEPAPTHEITLDDYFTLAFIAEQAISPDGHAVAYAEGRWQASTNDRKADLWVADAETGEATRLTFDRAGYNSLQWTTLRQQFGNVHYGQDQDVVTQVHELDLRNWRQEKVASLTAPGRSEGEARRQ